MQTSDLYLKKKMKKDKKIIKWVLITAMSQAVIKQLYLSFKVKTLGSISHILKLTPIFLKIIIIN